MSRSEQTRAVMTAAKGGRPRRPGNSLDDRNLLDALLPDYGWAALFVEELCAIAPDLTGLVVKAPAHTRHYVALAIVGAERRGGNWKRQLAAVIAACPRRQVLADAWGQDLGSTRVLMRLGPDLFAPVTYEALATVMADPARRLALGDVRHATELAIGRIGEAPGPLVSRYRGRLIASFGPRGLAFLIDGIARIRPDLTPVAIRRSLNALKKPSRIDHLLARLARNLTLPEPPWAGTALIKPLRTVPELRATGRRLQNCLGSLAIWTEALSGQRAFYLVEGRELAVVALARHPVFGTWFVHALAKRRNGTPTEGAGAGIIAAFAKAGFPHLEGCSVGAEVGIGL